MRNNSYALAFIVILFSGVPMLACQSQDIHPKKAAYRDAMNWPLVQPGDVELRDFQPFRAVYERTYTDGSGSQVTDRVIVSAENIGWDGEAAIAISLTDSGVPENATTNARSLVMYVRKSDLSVLFEIGPRPGTAKDYYVGRKDGDKLYLNSVVSNSDARDTQVMETSAPGFGPGTWIMANADLSDGKKVRLDPMYSPRANAITGFANIAHVVGSEAFTYPDGSSKKAWILEHATNPTSAFVVQRPVVDQPPYLLGSRSVNLDTGESSVRMKLVDFQLLGN